MAKRGVGFESKEEREAIYRKALEDDRIRQQEFIDAAKAAGFTQTQAEFLEERARG